MYIATFNPLFIEFGSLKELRMKIASSAEA